MYQSRTELGKKKPSIAAVIPGGLRFAEGGAVAIKGINVVSDDYSSRLEPAMSKATAAASVRANKTHERMKAAQEAHSRSVLANKAAVANSKKVPNKKKKVDDDDDDDDDW